MGEKKEEKRFLDDDENQAPDVQVDGNAGFFLSVFNLMNAILGSGILGLSYAMAQLGILLFTIICGGVAGLALYAITLLLEMCKITKANAYETIGQRAYGNFGRLAVAGCIFCQNMGAMSSYLFIIKTELPSVLQGLICDLDDATCLSHSDPDRWYFNGTYVLILVTLVVVMPLASFRNIEFLGYTSGFSISCMVFFTIVIVVKYFIGSESCPLFDDGVASGAVVYAVDQFKDEANVNWLRDNYLVTANATEKLMHQYVNGTAEKEGHIHPWCASKNGHLPERYCNLEQQVCEAKYFDINSNTVYSMPTMTFSFVCHTAVLPIYAELRGEGKQKVTNMMKVAATSIGSCFTLYFIASLFGYLTFFNYVQSELLMTYSHSDPTNPLTMIVRICVLIGVILTLPLVHFPTRRAVNFVLFPGQDFSWVKHIAVMVCLIGTCVILVISVPDIRDIFGFVGASSSGCLIFILPSLFYLKTKEGSIKDTPAKMRALVFLIFGCCFSILTLGVMIISKINP